MNHDDFSRVCTAATPTRSILPNQPRRECLIIFAEAGLVDARRHARRCHVEFLPRRRGAVEATRLSRISRFIFYSDIAPLPSTAMSCLRAPRLLFAEIIARLNYAARELLATFDSSAA